MGDFRMNDDVISDLKRRRLLPECVGNLAAKHDGVFRVCIPVQLEACSRGKVGVARLSAGLRIGTENGPLRAFRNSKWSQRVRTTGRNRTKYIAVWRCHRLPVCQEFEQS